MQWNIAHIHLHHNLLQHPPPTPNTKTKNNNNKTQWNQYQSVHCLKMVIIMWGLKTPAPSLQESVSAMENLTSDQVITSRYLHDFYLSQQIFLHLFTLCLHAMSPWQGLCQVRPWWMEFSRAVWNCLWLSCTKGVLPTKLEDRAYHYPRQLLVQCRVPRRLWVKWNVSQNPFHAPQWQTVVFTCGVCWLWSWAPCRTGGSWWFLSRPRPAVPGWSAPSGTARSTVSAKWATISQCCGWLLNTLHLGLMLLVQFWFRQQLYSPFFLGLKAVSSDRARDRQTDRQTDRLTDRVTESLICDLYRCHGPLKRGI